MFEPLESRCLFTAVDTSSVALYDTAGNPATINKHMAVFFVVHGDNMSEALMQGMGQAVQAQLPASQYQVLLVDWSTLSASAGNASKIATAVGDRVAQMINQARLPASRVNLIGFSMGGTVIGQVAADLKTKSTQVNRIIGIDPAAGRYAPAGYAQNSSYSIAFSGHDKYGGDAGSEAADDAVLLTGLNTNDLYRHANVFSVVTTMWQRDAGTISRGSDGVSSLFSIPQIMAGTPLPWKQNEYVSGYEAEAPCGYQSGLPNDLGPLSLTYMNRRGHTITVA